jgi:hypothetical protein
VASYTHCNFIGNHESNATSAAEKAIEGAGYKRSCLHLKSSIRTQAWAVRSRSRIRGDRADLPERV